MLPIGVNRSPYTRRGPITPKAYGLPYEQRDLSGFGNRAGVRTANPLGRIPALVLDNGETLVDSAAIIDRLDERVGREQAPTPPAGADRRAVLRVAALMMGACDKGLHAAYERNQALAAVEAMTRPGLLAAGSPHPGRRHRLHRRAPGARPEGRHGDRDAASARAVPQAARAGRLPLDRTVTA